MRPGYKFNKLNQNSNAIMGIIGMNDETSIHANLDRMVNSVDIFYTSKNDFEKNYPASNDIDGKVKLILARKGQ